MKIRGGTVSTPMARGVVLSDTEIGDRAWSSKVTVDKLCPSFEKTGTVVQCEPMEGSDLVILGEEVPGTHDIAVCGKNLYDKTTYPCDTDGYPIKKTGTFSASETYRRTGFIPCSHIAGQTITLNYAPVTANNPGMAFYRYIPEVNDVESCKAAFCGGGTGYNTEVPSDAKYMCFCVAVANKDKDIQIEIGSEATVYEPFAVYGRGTLVAPGESIVIAASRGINTVYGLDQSTLDVAVLNVIGKADPVALIDKLTEAVRSLGGDV